MSKEQFTTATTLQEFLQNDENQNIKQIKRYLRKVNNVVIDNGYSCKILIEKITSSTIKLKESYGPLIFTNYVDIENLYKYVQYKLTNIKPIKEFEQTENIALTEKLLEFTDSKLDFDEALQNMLLNEFDKLRIVYNIDNIEIHRLVDDVKLFTITINDFGRGEIKHHLLGSMKTNDLDFFNSAMLILFGKIVEVSSVFNFSTYVNCVQAILHLQRQTKLHIPELPQEIEIREFLHSIDDVVISKNDVTTTITRKSRIKIEITSIHDIDNLVIYKRSFKSKDVNADTLYDLVKHVIFLI